jgi:hypothetical protein
LKPFSFFILTKYILFPTGFTFLFIGYLVLFNLNSCSKEIIDYRVSIAEAEENFIEGYVDTKENLIKTRYSGTLTVAFLEEEDTQDSSIQFIQIFKIKNKVKSLKSNIVPFLLKSKNNYIYFGFYGKEFSIEHDFDFIYENKISIQSEKHIYNNEYISIFTEKGNLKQPDSISTPFIFFRGSRQNWLLYLDKKILDFEKKISICYVFITLGIFIILSSVYIRKKVI